MGKGKLTLLDVRAIVKELRSKLVGLRVANIYHLNAKTFLLKLSGSDVKQTLLVESGARIHTTKYEREHDKMPSNFAVKLRKHLRLQKLEDIQQVGNDRIIDLQFGRGEKCHHLILEFYDQGNIILTDANLEIIVLLRTHTYGPAVPLLVPAAESGAAPAGAQSAALPAGTPSLLPQRSSTSSKGGPKGKPKSKPKAASTAAGSDDDEAAGEEEEEEEDRVAVRSKYPMSQVQMPQQHITLDMIQASLQRQVLKERAEAAAMPVDPAPAAADAASGDSQADSSAAQADGKPAASTVAAPAAGSDDTFRNQQGKKQQAREQQKLDAARRLREEAEAKKRLAKPKMRQGMPIKAVLAQDLHFGPDVIEHCLLKSNIDPNQTTAAFVASAAQTADASLTHDAVVFSPALLSALCDALQEAPKLLERISSEKMPGYIFWKVEHQAASKPAQPQQPQQPRKPKPQQQQRKNKAGELVVDEIDAGATVATAVAASAAPVPADDASASVAPSADASTSSSAASPAAASETSDVAASAAPAAAADPSDPADVTIYTEYVPMLLATHSTRGEYRTMPAPLTFDSFDDALDEFYSKQEEQKEQVRLIKEKAQALQKLEREKARQAAQLAALATQQSLSVAKAELIEQNLDAVNACIGAVNAEIAKGTDWRDLTRTIKEEKVARANPIAMMIHSLNLLENHVTLTLSEGMRHIMPQHAGDRSIPTQQVDIDLALSAFSNAQNYYDFKRKHALKQAKAESASALAIKAAERKTHVALSQVDQKARIQKTRKVYWFEKFHWFISSENFLAIGGKDAQQNETLVKRYMKKGDVYVHAEVHGASSVLVKNHMAPAPVPPLTLSQAGSMTICRSAAWKDKIVVEAYWVHADQVSKSAPTGLSLPTGSFMIRGRKNFLPRMPLTMGIGLLFRLDDSCRSKHAGERRVRAAGDEHAAAPEDKFDQVGELQPLTSASQGGDKRASSSSSKKKKSSGGGSTKKKPQSAAVDEDFDVTSNVIRSSASGSTAAVARLSSEDEGTDAEAEGKRTRIAELVAEAGGAKPAVPAGKKKMSAAERKRMKKGTAAATQSAEGQEEKAPAASAVESAPAAAAADDDDSSDGEDFGPKKKKNAKKKRGAKGAAAGAAAGSGAPAAAAAAPPAKPLPRGKRNKMKRAADRYKDQDEEDLLLAASLLGLQNVDKKKKELAERERSAHAAAVKDESEEEDSSEEESSGEEDEESKSQSASAAAAGSSTAATPAAAPVDDSRVCFGCKQRGHVFKQCPNRDESGAGASTFAAARRAAVTAEESEMAKLAAEEGVVPEDDEAAGEGDSAAQAEFELSGLTGRPLPDDLCHFALPVCAPYDALASYKFKLKLLPGAAKKGKVAKQAMQLFMDKHTAAITREETELLKLVPEQDLINVLMSNAKISAPGQQGDGKKRKSKPKPAAASKDD